MSAPNADLPAARMMWFNAVPADRSFELRAVEPSALQQPVLHEDQLVARVDPAIGSNAGRLSIKKVSVEPGCEDPQVARAT